MPGSAAHISLASNIGPLGSSKAPAIYIETWISETPVGSAVAEKAGFVANSVAERLSDAVSKGSAMFLVISADSSDAEGFEDPVEPQAANKIRPLAKRNGMRGHDRIPVNQIFMAKSIAATNTVWLKSNKRVRN